MTQRGRLHNPASGRSWSSSNVPDWRVVRSRLVAESSDRQLQNSWASTSQLSSDNERPMIREDDSDDLTSLPQIPDSHIDPAIPIERNAGNARAATRHSFSNILSSLEDFRHAAGRKLKHRRSFVRRGASAIQEEDVDENSISPAWANGTVAGHQSARSPAQWSTNAKEEPLSSTEQSWPRYCSGQQADTSSLNPAGGEGARAAAALARLMDKTKLTTEKIDMPSDLSQPMRRVSSVSSDNESGIEVGVDETSDLTLMSGSVVPLKDPARLPTEIFTKIMTFLDSNSLVKAELVSRQWREVAKSHHVWKFAFAREFTEPARIASGSDQAVSAGGFGLEFQNGHQPWKKMWQVRKQLDQRWQDGHAAAVYLVGHHDSVYCVQFDQKKIVTGSRDWTVRVWDTKTLRCTHVLGTAKDVNTIHQPLNARKKQGRQPVASIIPPGPFEPPILVKSDERHTGSVLCIDYDEDMMVTGSSDCSVIVWSTADGNYTALKQLKIHTMGVLDVRLSDKYIVACSKDTTVSVWDRRTLTLVRVLNGHRGPVNAVQLRGNFVVSASGDGVAKMWNLTTGACVKEFHPPGDENTNRSRGLACVEFTHDARMIFAGGNDKKVYQFDTSSGNMVRTFTGHESLVRSLHCDAANGRIVTGSYDHAVWTYDSETGEPICNFKNWTTSWMLSARADYRRIVAASQDGKAVIMDFGHNLPGVELLEGSH